MRISIIIFWIAFWLMLFFGIKGSIINNEIENTKYTYTVTEKVEKVDDTHIIKTTYYKKNNVNKQDVKKSDDEIRGLENKSFWMFVLQIVASIISAISLMWYGVNKMANQYY